MKGIDWPRPSHAIAWAKFAFKLPSQHLKKGRVGEGTSRSCGLRGNHSQSEQQL